MSITTLSSLSQLNGILAKAGTRLSVIDFHATWCGPCHMIAPTFEALSKQHTDVNFLKCDVDAAADVAAQYRVQAMPTFVFIKNQSVVDTIKGANKSFVLQLFFAYLFTYDSFGHSALESAVRKHSGSSGSSATFSGKGQTLGGSNTSSTPGQQSAPFIPGLPDFITKMDPQARVLVLLLGAYGVFWLLS